MQKQERRAKQRYPIQLPIVITHAAAPSGEIHGVTRDMSSRGVFFYVDHWPVKHKRIRFKLILPSEITLARRMRAVCAGKVVRVEAGMAGARTGVAATIDKHLRFTPFE